MILLNAYSMPDFSDPGVWVSLLTLTFLEIVLGVDNIVFISIASNKLEESERPRAIKIGLILAMLLRIMLLFGVSYIIAMQEPFFYVTADWFNGGFTGQSLILMAGGIFLLYKATSEIHHKLEAPSVHEEHGNGRKKMSTLTQVILQITLINIVFSFDSILTAIGLTDNLIVMIIAVVVSMLIMMIFANPVSKFVNEHPTFQMLGLAFLILIGFMLIAEGAHLSHLKVFGAEIGTVPKGYLYFAIAFSLSVEVLNMQLRKVKKPVELHGYAAEAKRQGLLDGKAGTQ